LKHLKKNLAGIPSAARAQNRKSFILMDWQFEIPMATALPYFGCSSKEEGSPVSLLFSLTFQASIPFLEAAGQTEKLENRGRQNLRKNESEEICRTQ
jgi:hypothetical protein